MGFVFWVPRMEFPSLSRLPRSLAPAGVHPLRAMVPCFPPKRSHAVPIGRVLAGCSCTSGGVVLGRTEDHSSFLACRWSGASPDASRSVHRWARLTTRAPLGRIFLGAALVANGAGSRVPITRILKQPGLMERNEMD